MLSHLPEKLKPHEKIMKLSKKSFITVSVVVSLLVPWGFSFHVTETTAGQNWIGGGIQIAFGMSKSFELHCVIERRGCMDASCWSFWMTLNNGSPTRYRECCVRRNFVHFWVVLFVDNFHWRRSVHLLIPPTARIVFHIISYRRLITFSGCRAECSLVS